MRITKKIPIKPRGRAEQKKHIARDAIREAYTQPQKDVTVIPAKRDMIPESEKKKLRVCAYCRVSTEEESQEGSYELQVQHYTQMISENPEWDFVDIYADEGISGTSVLHRDIFLRMIEDCKAGKIDLVITKQVSRFARNVLDSLQYIRILRQLDPPVGILFETENLNTLDKTSDMIITVFSSSEDSHLFCFMLDPSVDYLGEVISIPCLLWLQGLTNGFPSAIIPIKSIGNEGKNMLYNSVACCCKRPGRGLLCMQ